MSIKEIKAAIEQFPGKDFIEIRKWMAGREWEVWNERLEAASKAGELDFLIKEALDEERCGRLKEL